MANIMDYVHNISEEDLIKEIEKARVHAKREDSEVLLSFGANNLKIKEEDDYFLAGHENGYISFHADDFSSENIISMLESNNKLVTPELLQKVVVMFIEGLDEAKA